MQQPKFSWTGDRRFLVDVTGDNNAERPRRRPFGLLVLLIVLFIVVLIYTVGLFLMLEERISASHAATLDYF